MILIFVSYNILHLPSPAALSLLVSSPDLVILPLFLSPVSRRPQAPALLLRALCAKGRHCSRSLFPTLSPTLSLSFSPSPPTSVSPSPLPLPPSLSPSTPPITVTLILCRSPGSNGGRLGQTLAGRRPRGPGRDHESSGLEPATVTRPTWRIVSEGL